MKCPYCLSELIVTGQKSFETIAEHVMNPNQENFPLRDIYTCPNKCENSNNHFWNKWGECYSMGDINSHWKDAITE